MAAARDTWTISHFALANPGGAGQDSVPRLVRRLADELDRRPEIEVQDIVFRMELDSEGGDRPSATVSFHARDET